jgi:hypothetical protein
LKNLIKVHTTEDQGRGILIPEQSNIASKEVEDLFLNELSNQHDCVDLFVKSKADEICRRLREQLFVGIVEMELNEDQKGRKRQSFD